ncbi:uncharacterized protein LOC134196056 [Corticium candelabrum]|uniref:uncharacterized protein LOC134196056 n=1 Tax=Corticium candelabrum TaxID=121492 RepID=UPI002E25CD43|nr:uncharacterized protein LOC134196056 [Corticium candelabrum]
MDEADIRRMVEEGISHSEISYRLRRRHPGVRGLSERSVRRFCFEYDILNPIPYYAQYCGHKMHIDQNEKLVMYEVTHVLAIDGYSGFILGIITIPSLTADVNVRANNESSEIIE